jgi:hypothetical protein
MKTHNRLAAIGLLAAAAAAPAVAGGDDHRPRLPGADGCDRGMQAVANRAGRGEPGHGWQYFSDPAASRAVVISPQGEYYVSRGKGLHRVAPTGPMS